VSTPGALDRSTLDSKDRNELVTIAKAMGAKPPSRARKADIVDLILEMAGGGDGADEGPGESATDAGSEDASGDAHTTDEESDSNGADGGNGDDGGNGADGGKGDDGGDGSEADGSDQGRANAGRGRRTGRTDSRKDNGQREDNGQRDSGKGDSGRGESGDDRGRNRDRNRDQAEPGNRKRRRRGRNNQDGDDSSWSGEPVLAQGHLDLRDDGYGFLRVKGAMPSSGDVYVPVKQVRELGLRRGDHLIGTSRPANRNEKNPALLTVESVNGVDPSESRDRRWFDDLTPLFPDEQLKMERRREKHNMTTRIIDLVSPIGKGTRGLIVSPPKAGKTTIMKEIIRSIEMNNPEVKLFVVLIDERPEEVTDMKRWVERGEVIASTFDRQTEEHTAVAEMSIERAKRMTEMGNDVVVILDGITRLARAYNIAAPAGGRTLSGGVDAGALYPPKKFLGAARNVEEGGSLTILATALVETGSRMDEVIFEEFKGTSNMELRLDRQAAERRVYPAIDVDGSSTRRDELLFSPKHLVQTTKLRRVLQAVSEEGKGSVAGLELLVDRLGSFDTNDAFLDEIAKTKG